MTTSKMEGFAVLNTENNLAIGDQSKIDKETKASLGNTSRKKLADISNLPLQDRTSMHDRKSLIMPITSKEYVDQLQKENVALMKVLSERNKLIEVTGIEFQKLKINLQKMQQQNLQLAQSNSQMLVDLNSGKDRLKALQHELGCLNGVLKAKNMEVQKLKLQVKTREIGDDEVKQSNCEAAEESNTSRNDDKIGHAKKRTQSKSLSSSLQVQSKDTSENKRPCTRRKSARFEHEELKPDDGLVDTADAKFLAYRPIDTSLQENVSTSSCNDVRVNEVDNKRPCARRRSARFKSEEPKLFEDFFEKQEAKISACLLRDDKEQEDELTSPCSSKIQETEGISTPEYEAQVFRRSSLTRPLRQAAKKVQTYKEIPINMKMRRSSESTLG